MLIGVVYFSSCVFCYMYMCIMFCRTYCSSKITHSGPNLRRRPSRGTNINPFTPTEVQRRSRDVVIGVASEGQGEAWASTPVGGKDEVKSHKVQNAELVLTSVI